MRLCFYAALLAMLAVTSASAEPLKIGALFHLTGEFAIQGVAFREGAELALEELKADGLPELEIVFEDTRYLPLDTNTGAKRLAQMDGMQAILISTLTEGKTASPVLTQRKLPMLVLWDSSPELEKLSPFLFGLGPWTPNSGKIPAEFAFNQLKGRRAIVIDSNTEWSLAVSKFFKERFAELGGTVLDTFTINPGELDFNTVLTRARMKHPDVAFLPIDSSIPQLFQQAQRMRLGVPLVTSDIITEDNLEEAAEAFEGVYQANVSDPSFPETSAMLNAYGKRFAKKCTQPLYVAWAYDAVKLLGKVLKQGVRGGEPIRTALMATKEYHGAGGMISLDGKQSSPRPATMYQVRGGKFVPPGKVEHNGG